MEIRCRRRGSGLRRRVSGISSRVQKILWTNAGGICSYPGCGKRLIEDETRTGDRSLVGDMCHIVAADPNGPRGDSSIPFEERNSYDNLILLCKNHHKQVDKHTVKVLREYKNRHEQMIQSQVTAAAKERAEDGIYVSYAEEWSSRADLANWTEWTSHLVREEGPWMTVDQDRRSLTCGSGCFRGYGPGDIHKWRGLSRTSGGFSMTCRRHSDPGHGPWSPTTRS